MSGSPCSDNVLLWNAVIFGPEDTAFEDGTFKLLLSFDEGIWIDCWCSCLVMSVNI